MMHWIIASSLKFRFIVIASAAAMVFFGMNGLRTMSVDVFPEFAPPKVEIQTEGFGMSSSEVEELITIPMEEQLRGTPELTDLRSRTVNGLSQIVLLFGRGTDLMYARQLVQERLDQAIPLLPKSSGMPIMLQPLSSTSRAMKIGLTSETYDLMDLSMIAYWTIKFRLMSVPGVANVAIWGERPKSLTVQVDPALARAENVTLNEIMETTSESLDFGLLPYSNAAKTRTEGFIDTPNQRFGMQHVLPVVGPEELSQVALRVNEDGRTLRLGDVGDVVWATWPIVGDAVINDGEGLMLIVEKFPWANTLEVTEGVEAALGEISLPGIEVDTEIFRPATFIEMSVDNLTKALLIGVVLVVIVLFAFLYEWRVALISCTAIPLSLVAAGLVLYVRGATINTMVLAGFVIALGAVVDDAIIDIENIMRRLRLHRKERSGKSVARVILEASLEVRSAIVYATLIEVMALVPVFFLPGLSGAFFKPLAISYALAVLASMLVALTVTPALGLILLRNAPLDRKDSPLVRVLHAGYDRVLASVIRGPSKSYATVGVVAVAGLLVVPQLGQELLPSFKERDFLMHWLTKPGTSHPEMYRITVQASKELRAIPGVRNFGAHIGRAMAADEPVGMNFTENWISIDPAADYDETLAAVQTAVDGYPGLYRDVQTYLKERIREVLTGGGDAIIVRLFGPELDVLYETAAQVEDALNGIDGLVDLHVELQEEVAQIVVEVDLAAAQSYRVKPGDVIRAANAVMTGLEVSDIHHDGKVHDVNVWSIPEARHSLTDIRQILIDTPGGGYIELQDVADIAIRPNPNVIHRENLSRRIDVQANVRGRDLGSVVADVEVGLATVNFPLEYHAELLGEYKERQTAQRSMLIWGIFAALGILFLLQTSFNSWRLGILSFVTLPSALVGGALAAYFGSGIISLGSLVGFLTILGIAARNGIMLINHYQHLERHEGVPFGPELIRRGAQERLAPILMTALTTGLAILPLIVAGNIPGHEIEHPLAIVVLGGLVTSTLLNLFVLPALYLRFGREGEARDTAFTYEYKAAT